MIVVRRAFVSVVNRSKVLKLP